MNTFKKTSFVLLSISFAMPAMIAHAAGGHLGEEGRIEARVEFLDPAGQTTTNGSGTTYQSGGWSTHEDKVYSQFLAGGDTRLWGTFPLYFVGSTMRFRVHLTNMTTQGNKTFRVRIQALENVLETNGTIGMSFATPQEWIVEGLKPGDFKTLDGSIFIAPNPSLPSGLDVTRVRISHLNEGVNADAGLIKEEIAVWCPPDKKI